MEETKWDNEDVLGHLERDFWDASSPNAGLEVEVGFWVCICT